MQNKNNHSHNHNHQHKPNHKRPALRSQKIKRLAPSQVSTWAINQTMASRSSRRRRPGPSRMTQIRKKSPIKLKGKARMQTHCWVSQTINSKRTGLRSSRHSSHRPPTRKLKPQAHLKRPIRRLRRRMKQGEEQRP